MTQNTENYRIALADLDKVVAGVGDWSATTPCEGWSAAHLVGHLMQGMAMVSGVDAGEDVLANAGDDPGASYASARDAALAALTDERCSETVQGPMGPMPLDQMLGMFLTNDVLIHTWDMAKASGQEVTLDPTLTQAAYDTLLPIDAMVRGPRVFGPKVEPPADADMQTKLMCFVGRQAP